METKSRELHTYESFIYTLDVASKICDNSEQLWEGTQQVVHTLVSADKYPTIHDTIQKEKGSIVEKIKQANVHQHSATTQQDNITRDAEDNPINLSRPKTGETIKYHRTIQKCSQDATVVQIADLLQEYQTLFPLNGT